MSNSPSDVRNHFSFDDLTTSELDARRSELVKKAAGNYENLSIDDLRELSALSAARRRRTAGPPKAKPAKAKKEKVATQSLEDILAGL